MPAPNDASGEEEILPQAEGEGLAAEASEIEQTAPVPPEGGEPPAKGGPRPFDFRQPAFLPPAELRRLRLRYEDFVRSLSARLSIYLRLEFSLQLQKLHTIAFRAFAESLSSPTHLSLFKSEPLRGIGILEVPPALALSIIDRLLGGPAQAPSPEHAFSEIEIALLDQVVQLVLAEWCSLWSGLQELHPTLLGHEDNGKFLQTAPRDTLMLVLGMEARIGEGVAQMQLAVPCYTVEPLLGKLTQPLDLPPTDTRLSAPFKWNRNFDDVPVPVTAIWSDLQLTARELANLKAGDVLPLDAQSAKRVKLRLADLPRFEGALGTSNGKWAVAVTGVLKTPTDH